MRRAASCCQDLQESSCRAGRARRAPQGSWSRSQPASHRYSSAPHAASAARRDSARADEDRRAPRSRARAGGRGRARRRGRARARGRPRAAPTSAAAGGTRGPRRRRAARWRGRARVFATDARRLAGGGRAHRDVVLLVRGGRDRVDARGMGERLVLGGEGGGGDVRDHEAGAAARRRARQEGGQAGERRVDQPLGAALADGAELGDRDGQHVGGEGHRLAVEVAAREQLARRPRRPSGCRWPRSSRSPSVRVT